MLNQCRDGGPIIRASRDDRTVCQSESRTATSCEGVEEVGQGVPDSRSKAAVAGSAWFSRTRARREQSSRPVDEDLLGGLGVSCLVGSFDELAVDEGGAGADEGDQVRAVDRAPAVL